MPVAASASADSDTPTGGSIVVNVMLDYETLPFITARNPYNELIRPADSLPPEGSAGRSVQFVVYGWGRGSLYSSNTRAFPLDDTLLGVIAQSRRPFWTTMSDGEREYSTYIQNDRVGIYVIGFPVVTRLDHLINLAELTTLVGLTYVLLLALSWSVSALGGTTAASGRALLREVRASFYRKLFLAFLAASVLPVMVLALATRTFFELQLESSVQSDAVRVAAVAQRVIEEYVALQERDAAASPSDDIMVWLSRAIDQDVNIYQRPDAARDERARPVRLGPAARADARPCLSRDRDRAAVEPCRPGSDRRGSARARGGARPARGRARDSDRAARACGSRKSTARSTRSIAACCSRPCCSRCLARRSAIRWPSASAIR